LQQHVVDPQDLGDIEAEDPAVPHMAKTFWLIVTFDTDGEVIFVEDKQAAKLALQGHTAPPSCLYLTSPSISLLVKAA
jgi:hypothetical protein